MKGRLSIATFIGCVTLAELLDSAVTSDHNVLLAWDWISPLAPFLQITNIVSFNNLLTLQKSILYCSKNGFCLSTFSVQLSTCSSCSKFFVVCADPYMSWIVESTLQIPETLSIVIESSTTNYHLSVAIYILWWCVFLTRFAWSSFICFVYDESGLFTFHN